MRRRVVGAQLEAALINKQSSSLVQDILQGLFFHGAVAFLDFSTPCVRPPSCHSSLEGGPQLEISAGHLILVSSSTNTSLHCLTPRGKEPKLCCHSL